MLLDVTEAILEEAQAFNWVITTQLLDQVGCVARDLLGELNGVYPSQDNVVGLHWVRAGERRAGRWRRSKKCEEVQ